MPSEEVWEKAGQEAADSIGWDDNEPCWDSFGVEVDGFEFFAELASLTDRGIGTVRVTHGEESRIFDESGCEN